MYLIGSHATGANTNTSDYDFIAVVSDDCPAELSTQGSMWRDFYDRLNNQRRKIGLKEIDIFLKHESSFIESGTRNDCPFNPARDAVTYGVKLEI